MNPPAFKTILVGDNGTPDSERAVKVAISLAASLQARVIVLGVLSPPSPESQAEGYGLDRPAKTRKLLEEKFAALQQSAQNAGIDLTTEMVEGLPDKMIEQRAHADAADLIVVGHRDVTRIRHWLEGSTSEHLVKRSKISVLVVR